MSMFKNINAIEAIRAAAEADESQRPLAFESGDVPWAIEAVTPQWLDASLGEGAGKAKILDARVEGASSGTSVRGSIALMLADGSERHLFAKTYPTFEHRIANILSGTAEAEGRFYLELRDGLDIESPAGAFWAWDNSRLYRAIVIVEDIAWSRQAQFCNVATTINRAEMEDAVRLMARYHAAFRDTEQLRAGSPWLKTFPQWASEFEYLEGEHLEAMRICQDVIPSSLHDAGKEIFDKFMLGRSGRPSDVQTLIHSDVHLGNWYKTGDGRMGLCDWQCCNIGAAARDLAYAMTTMLDVGDRRAWERDIVSAYAQEFEQRSGLSLDRNELFDSYRRFALAALLSWTPTLVPGPNMPAMQPEALSRLIIERTTNAIADLNSLAAFD